MMKKWFGVLVIPLVIVVLVILVKTTSSSYDESVCQGHKIIIKNPNNNNLVEEQEVISLLSEKYGLLVGKKMDLIDSEKIRTILVKHPYIKKAKIYKGLDANIVIEIDIRDPLLRVFPYKGDSFIIDRNGDLMPLLDDRSFDILVLSGKISCLPDSVYGKNIFSLQSEYCLGVEAIISSLVIAKALDGDKIFRNLFSQIWINSTNDIELIPLIGDFTIKFGGSENINEKLERIKILYTEVVPYVDLRMYESVNITVSNQLVFRKR